jgi:L-ascorbate metabolism protein UlaG (beta-lactamase superfamily)
MRIHLSAILITVAIVGASVAADTFTAAGGQIEITPILHASVQIEFRGTVVQVDPWSAADLSKVKAADLILVTDIPAHHLDVKAIGRLRKPGAPVVIPAVGKDQVPDGVVLANGASATLAGMHVEAIAAYDLVPGAPEHPKGKANGYLITIGGARLYFAGVTQCVPEMLALTRVDVAFLPMNIPPARMTPSEVAGCVKALKPKVVYLNHYDNDAANRLTNPTAKPQTLPGGLTTAQTLVAFKQALAGEPVDVRLPDWYATRQP